MVRRFFLMAFTLTATLSLGGCLLLDQGGPDAAKLTVTNMDAPDGTPTLCTQGLEGIIHFAGLEFRSDRVMPGDSWSTGVLDVRYGMKIDLEAVCYGDNDAEASSIISFGVQRNKSWPGVAISAVYPDGTPDSRDCPAKFEWYTPCVTF